MSDEEIPDHWLVQYLRNDAEADKISKYNCSVARTIMGMSHTKVMDLADERGLTSQQPSLQ